MKSIRRILITASVLALTTSSIVAAQQDDANAQTQQLTKEMSELKREMAALRTELQSLRKDLTKTVAALEAAQKKPAPRQRPAMTMIGKKAPEFTVTTIDGKKIQIGGKREKPQVMFCYASWCGYCNKSLPWMESLYQEYKDKGVEVLALNLDARGEGGRARTEKQTLDHYKGLKLSLPMTMKTDANDTTKIGTTYKAQSFPTLFVLGTSGEVESVHIGARPDLGKIVGKELDLLMQGKPRTEFPK